MLQKEAEELKVAVKEEVKMEKEEEKKDVPAVAREVRSWESGYTVRLEEREYKTLAPKECLDDLILGTYCHIINGWVKKNSAPGQVKLHAFSTYLFKTMQSKAPEIAESEIQRALKKSGYKSLDEFDMLLVPINDELR